jgi:hypothetical protein
VITCVSPSLFCCCSSCNNYTCTQSVSYYQYIKRRRSKFTSGSAQPSAHRDIRIQSQASLLASNLLASLFVVSQLLLANMNMLSRNNLMRSAPAIIKGFGLMSAVWNGAMGAMYATMPHQMMDLTGCKSRVC